MIPDAEAFAAWLRRQGADVLAPTNPYELARFRARGAVHIIYTGRRGITANGFAAECLAAFNRNGNLGMGFTHRRRRLADTLKATLLARDGDHCFFCWKDMRPGDISIEHLVALGKGGPNHTDNMALAHNRCNREAGNMALMEKIQRHVRAILNHMGGLDGDQRTGGDVAGRGIAADGGPGQHLPEEDHPGMVRGPAAGGDSTLRGGGASADASGAA